MEEFVKAQKEINEEIKRVLVNVKKDSSTRKNDEKYYIDRIKRVEALWSDFEKNDLQIQVLEGTARDHEYFKDKCYVQVYDLVETTIENLEAERQALIKQRSDGPGSDNNGSKQRGHKARDPDRDSGSSNILQILRNRKALIRAIERNIEDIKKEITSPQDLTYFELKVKLLEKYETQLITNNEIIWNSTSAECIDGYTFEHFFDIESKMQNALISLKGPLRQETPVGDNKHNMHQSTPLQVHLPKITIPTFDGQYLKWMQFRDLFVQLIDKQDISPIQEMFYLSTNLSGEPKALIKHLPVSADNYKIAWEILTNRYDNKRALVTALLNKLFSQPTASINSARSLKTIHDVTKECLLGLKAQGLPVHQWDALIVHLLLKRLDSASHSLFEQSLEDSKQMVSLSDLLQFLENRFQALQTVDNASHNRQDTSNKVNKTLLTVTKRAGCEVCNSNHSIFGCPIFKGQTVQQRREVVKQHNLCFNCLKGGHMAVQCTKGECNQCQGKHNTLLHRGKQPIGQSKAEEQKLTPKTVGSNTVSAISASVTRRESKDYILLGTARIVVVSNDGMPIVCRAILDSGSQVNLVTERLLTRLGLKPSHKNISIEGVGRGRNNISRRVVLNVQSRISGYQTMVEAYVLPHIISDQPAFHFRTEDWNIPHNIQLADPDFSKSDKIDLLLGAEFHHQLLINGQITLSNDLPTLQNTQFGWLVAGKIQYTNATPMTCGICTTDYLEKSIERLWKLEEVDNKVKILSTAEKQCEAQFNQTLQNNVEGRFVVRLPFLRHISELGNSQQIAYNRFLAIERKLSKDSKLKEQYVDFLRQYEALGHMTEVNIDEVTTPKYFIPHHCVVKPESTTTKLRVVFDASAKTSSGWSLNDLMHTGPTIQSDLFSILLRFRLPRFVFKTDVEKMYRQILVHPEDRKLQLIIWREDAGEPIKYYQLNTVTYGTRAAPYLATKCLQVIAERNSNSYPLAARTILNNFYVDDCLSGCDSLAEARQTQTQLIELLQKVGFKLKKWCANSKKLLEGIPNDDHEVNLDLEDKEYTTHTLGLSWHPGTDKLQIKVSLQSHQNITKRTATSDLARIYDPLGLLTPVTVMARMFIQELWSLSVDWDQTLPPELTSRWIKFCDQLEALNNVNIPRHVFNGNIARSVQLHIFTDASEKAYGAAAYLRSTVEHGQILVRLLCAKSKVAPLKRLTLPRLELCAAVVGAQLAQRIRDDLNFATTETFYWSDSQITLSWINTPSARFHTFVANRVATIQELTIAKQWRHVSSKDNPADVLSRGMLPNKLAECSIWFYCPFFLHGTEEHWPTSFNPELVIETESDPELRKSSTLTVVGAISIDAENDIINNIDHKNSFRRLQRIVGYVLRFIQNSRHPSVPRKAQILLSVKELEEALVVILTSMQKEAFKNEIKDLRLYQELRKDRSLSNLSPFLDKDGLIRVGGRLDASTLSFNAKHQVVIPYNSPLSKLIFQMVHIEQLHCGPQSLLSHVRQRFWPIKGKCMARSTVQHCIPCTRAKPILFSQVMGNLPAMRVTPSRPFINTGVDFCGPFWIHYKLRGKRPTKAYIAVFCCFSTKAVHLELVSDLTANAFIGSLKRFTSRRGQCQTIFCDNATNFVGAKNQLKELGEALHSKNSLDKIVTDCSKRGIEFKFIPPRAPHFGGLWEAAVKSAKHHLVRSAAGASLTYEELETFVVEVEGILNSRPLTPMSSNPNDLTALTPGHFLIGEPITATVDCRATEQRLSLLKRWELVSHLKHEFWRRWSTEYLNELQYKTKWTQRSKNASPGDLVIVKEDNTPVMKWPLGRIIKVYKGDDGVVRVADIRTTQGTWKRPVHRLAPLPVQAQEALEQPKENQEALEQPDENQEAIDQQEETPKRAHQNNGNNSTTPAKKRRASPINYMSMLIVLLFVLPLVTAEKVEVKNFKANLGIHFENIGELNLASSQWKFIVYYDLEPLKTEISTILTGTSMLQRLCANFKQKFGCEETLRHLLASTESLEFNDALLMPKRKKRGAMNIIGNVAGSLFGVLDSEYADKMAHTIENIKSNENHLAALLHNQTSVVDSTINLVTASQIATKEQFQTIDAHINDIVNKVAEEEHQLKLHQIFLSTVAQITLMIGNVQRADSALMDVLIDTHHGKINPLLLSTKQLTAEFATIRAHMPIQLEIPVENGNLLQLYKIMTVKGGLTSQHAIFELTLPLMNSEQFDMFKMIPIPTTLNNTMVTVKLCAAVLAIGRHRDQYVPIESENWRDCIEIKSDHHLCFNLQAKHFKGSEICSCELGMFLNETKPTCTIEVTRTNSTWVQLEQKNQWIFSVRNPTKLTAVCQKESFQILIEGSGLLNLNPSCTVRGTHISIRGFQTFASKVRTTFASFGNISQVSNPTSLKTIDSNFHTRYDEQQVEKLATLQGMLQKAEIATLSHEDHKHTSLTLSSAALVCSAFILICVLWHKHLRARRTIAMSPAIPTPTPRKLRQPAQSTFTIHRPTIEIEQEFNGGQDVYATCSK